ncbi:MAG: helical backbone metal receptor [Elusimicrobiota bacterium]|jgi:iron complex transport system substrate-binding protein|nr:helical backbone metal receptor [Elusimicrobiota bacterium]
MKSYLKLFLFSLAAVLLLAAGIFVLRQKTAAAGAPALPVGGGVVSLLPSNTEILFELGAGGRVIAVSNYCTWPEEVKNIAKIGDSFAADSEAIYRLRPAMVYLSQTAEALQMRLAGLGVPYTAVPDALTAADIYDNIALIAAREGLDAAPLLKNLPPRGAPKPAVKTRAFIEIDDDLWTTGGQSFVSDLLEYAGIENIFKDTAAGYFQTSAEAASAARPDIIVSVKHRSGGYLPAGLHGLKVIRLDPDIFSRPTPRALRAAALLSAQI